MRLSEIMMLKATVLPSWIKQRMKERKEVTRTALKGTFWWWWTLEIQRWPGVPPSLANAQTSLEVVAKDVMLAAPIRRARMTVRATLTPMDPVLVNEFWKGEDAFIASSRLPTVNSIVIIIANPRAAQTQSRSITNSRGRTNLR